MGQFFERPDSSDSEQEFESASYLKRFRTDRPPSWFHAFKRYVQETDGSLDFNSLRLKIPEMAPVLELMADSLADSQRYLNSASHLKRFRPDRPPSWFHAFKRYVLETDVSSLDLSSMHLKIPEVTSILELLADSQVTELALSDNMLINHMNSLAPLLIKTKIQKLSVRQCRLKQEDTVSLLKVLKETHVTDLDISQNNFFDFDEGSIDTFISYLVKSRLTVLNLLETFPFYEKKIVVPFIQGLRLTSITHLSLEGPIASSSCDSLLCLLRELKHTSITHLNVVDFKVGECDFKLGESLRDSKLVELALRDCEICDDNVDDLFRAIIGSKITSLSLASNDIDGENNLGTFLKKTQITHLDLSKMPSIEKANMFAFPDFLRGSSVQSLKMSECQLPDVIGVPLMRSLRFSEVTELDVSKNRLTFTSIEAFAGVIKDTNITSFNFSENYGRNSDLIDQGLLLIGELSVGSQLKHLDLHSAFDGMWNSFDVPVVVGKFFEKLANSPITSLNMSSFAGWLEKRGAEAISPFLATTQITHLNLEGNKIMDGVLSLAANLKFTAITHLNLSDNGVDDEGAKALAECLKDTKIIDLNLSSNKITCCGATALALFLKDVDAFNLTLYQCDIEDEGLEALAESIELNLITSLDVFANLGNAYVFETVLWNNRRIVRQLVSFFQRIVPKTDDNFLRFEEPASATNIDTFLEECLRFYKLVMEQPSAARALAREESIAFSKDQVATLLLDEFPKQFTWFISSKIEADTSEHVRFLRRVEELGLSSIVELLLLNRPLYTIDESRNILHPFVYGLLIKYKLPVCNLDVEPQGIERIVQYFTTFANIEGAADVVSMLKDVKKTIKKAENLGGALGTVNSAEPSNEGRVAKNRRQKN